MDIYELPGYHISNDTMLGRYSESLTAAVYDYDLLYEHFTRWRAAWELWPRPTKAITRILNYDISELELSRLQEAVSDKENFIPSEDDELVNELLVPATFLVAMFVSKKFECPFCTALHQSFCELEDPFQLLLDIL